MLLGDRGRESDSHDMKKTRRWLRPLFTWSMAALVVAAMPAVACARGADFSGDSVDDVPVVYDYGSSTTGFWVFDTTSGFSKPRLLWKSAAGAFSAPRTRAVVGYVNSDALGDIIAMYDHGGGTTSLFVIPGAPGTSAPKRWWKSATGGFSASRVKLTTARSWKGAGGVDPYAVYDYGNSTTGIWSFSSASRTSFSPSLVWKSKAGGWSWARSKVAGGDFNADGKGDVAVAYDCGGATTALWLFKSNGSVLVPSRTWVSARGGFDWKAIRTVVAGDFDGNGADDVAFLYDYYKTRVLNGKTVRYVASSSWFVVPAGSGAPRKWAGPITSGTRQDFAAADVTNEGRDEICYMGSSGIQAFYARDGASFGLGVIPVWPLGGGWGYARSSVLP